MDTTFGGLRPEDGVAAVSHQQINQYVVSVQRLYDMYSPILYLLGAYPRWSETFIRQDLELLLRQGMPLMPVALFAGDCEALPQWPAVPLLSSASEAHRDPSKACATALKGAVLRRLPKRSRTWLSLRSHQEQFATLCAMARRENVAHIHAEFADLPGLLAAAVARELNLSWSIGCHARDVFAGKYDPDFLFGHAAFLAVCNVAARQQLMVLAPGSAERIHLIHHGLLLEQWPWHRVPQRRIDTRRLLFVGRLVEKKGCDVLLRALEHLGGDRRNTVLEIVGDGPQMSALRQLADEQGVADRIAWTGVVPRNGVAEALHRADCLVVPSVRCTDGDQDGVPNVMLEAMAVGTPVLGTTTGSLPEALSEQTGWIARPGSAEDLAARILTMETLPEEVEKRCRNARKLIESEYDAQSCAGRRAELFDKVLQHSAGAARAIGLGR